MHESQVHDLYDYEPQPYLLGFQNEERIKRNGLKKTDFDFKSLIGVSMFGHIYQDLRLSAGRWHITTSK